MQNREKASKKLTMHDFVVEDYQSPEAANAPNPRQRFKKGMPASAKPFSIFYGQHPQDVKYANHESLKLKKPNGAEKNYFFKKNKGRNEINEIEAVSAHLNELIAPGYSSRSNVYYDDSTIEKNSMGIASAELPGFTTLKEKPLTIQDVANPDIQTGLACTLTAAFILEEDDLHIENMEASGRRVDFDMCLWPIASKYKAANISDIAFRMPSATQYIVTEYDIENLPCIKFAKPFYWPTEPHRLLSDSWHTWFTTQKMLNDHSYPEEQRQLFASLKDKPAFIYHKYKTLLKFILLNPYLFYAVSQKHIHHNRSYISDEIYNHLKERQEEFKPILLEMSHFKKFIQHHGLAALDDIVSECQFWNSKVIKKIKTNNNYQNCLINITNMQKSFIAIKQHCMQSKVPKIS